MGYACPVCEAPQADAKHLADHLAFTALLGDDEHEIWLEEHAPGWAEEDDAGLAERVVGEAEEVDLPVAGDDHDHTGIPNSTAFQDSSHEPGIAFDALTEGEGVRANANRPLDDEAQAALREAYELTRERRERAARQRDDGDVSADAGETE
ncbi:DUF5810 domain-containing protein [Halorhabdus amylolytica]|uniref:DUF5810 domain-containing protein n=1 Tax=Halorhabdus amylolytica TaxID=2559573 RepID=UPI0010AA0706|nr:DUF5810 domain-containing protein [Halorhabdus amylolytica]